MFKLIKRMARGYERYMTYRGRAMARNYLIGCDDRMLKDNGFSRELLAQGVDAWPWRTLSEQELQLRAIIDQASLKQAIRDLSSMSDKELQDLGINRGDIEQSVRSGRPGLDREQHLKVA